MGPGASWSPLKPDPTVDAMEWDEVRSWVHREYDSIFQPTPTDGILETADGLCFPQIPASVELWKNRNYRSGVCMRYEWSSHRRNTQAIQALNSATHPALRPAATATGYPEVLHVPGQLQLTPSVPLVVYSREKAHLGYAQTVEVLHTPSSLLGMPGMPQDTILIIENLARNVLGNVDADDPRDRKPLYACGLATNMRDKGAHVHEFEGSYSLAFTSGEGQGAGHVQPAVQTDDEYVRARQKMLLYDVGTQEG